jgi:hypothetical protein
VGGGQGLTGLTSDADDVMRAHEAMFQIAHGLAPDDDEVGP